MVEFGQGRWPFEQESQRYIKDEVIQVPNTVGMYLFILYFQGRDSIEISLQANIPLFHWHDPEIQGPVRNFLKIEDPNDINVRSDQFAKVVKFDFRKPVDSLNYFLMHRR